MPECIDPTRCVHFAGPHNFSLILTEDFGRAHISHSLMKTNGKDKVYNFQSYAGIVKCLLFLLICIIPLQ